MPVRLDKIPALAPRPAKPRIWLWLGLLPLLLLLGMGVMLLFGSQSLQQSVSFWTLGLGAPLLSWCLLCFGRALMFFGQQYAADGWDEARELDLIRKVRCGRRSQQVLGTSLFSALREPGEQGTAQSDALLSGSSALEAQPCWLDGSPVRHSRLSRLSDEDPELTLFGIVEQVLAELSPALAKMPQDTPLALLLEIDSHLPQNLLSRIWRKAWSASGIRQSTVPVTGVGLDALDLWLDLRIDDHALLMVVAVQFSPTQPAGTAEVAVGLLLGNRLTQTTLPAIAYLHRPEQERGLNHEHLLYAARQALDWVPLTAQSIERVWRAGIDARREGAIAATLNAVPLPKQPKQELCDLDALLGHAGHASPWLAIVAAAQTLERGAGPQFVFSGGSTSDAGLWGTVLTPASPPSK